MNLAPNGPNDGGLKVLRGSKQLYGQLFDAFAKDMPAGGWSEDDGFGFTEEMMQWFYDHGCKWEKLCANPGGTCDGQDGRSLGLTITLSQMSCFGTLACATMVRHLLRRILVSPPVSVTLFHDEISGSDPSAHAQMSATSRRSWLPRRPRLRGKSPSTRCETRYGRC